MDILISFAREFGFPTAVAAFVLLRLDRRLAHVEACLVRICAILSAQQAGSARTTGVHIEDVEEVTPLIREPSTLEPASKLASPVLKSAAGNTKGRA